MVKKVLFLALALFACANIHAEVTVATDSINGDDQSVTFVKISDDTYRAVLTNSTKPFDITVKAWEWARQIFTFESYVVNGNDSVQVTVAGGQTFWSTNMGWTKVLPGQKIALTEIRSDQGESIKQYRAFTALTDEEAVYYAAYTPTARPTVNRQANAASAPRTASVPATRGKKKGGKGRLTEEEVIAELAAGSGNYSIEVEGNPRIK